MEEVRRRADVDFVGARLHGGIRALQRGRRAALLASVAFAAAIVAWMANYFSGMHRFIAS